jgi:hypothetical protein
MQSEAGQPIKGIVGRKELERRAGEGLFFWGIGNAPSRAIKRLAAAGEDVDVVFSLMKGRPKARDASPVGVLAWRTYFDLHDIERPLPAHVLVTSRMEVGSGTKNVHYALMCWSDEELRLDEQGSTFDPSVYRNIGETGGPVSNSQVTALIVRTGAESSVSAYRINLRAKLAGSYWVKLGRPCILNEKARRDLAKASESAGEMTIEAWAGMISEIKAFNPATMEEQSYLF